MLGIVDRAGSLSIYLEHPDDGKSALSQQELVKRRTTQDWVVPLRGIPGVAEINSRAT